MEKSTAIGGAVRFSDYIESVTAPKPRIAPSTDHHGNPYYRVTYRGLKGSIAREEHSAYSWSATYWPADKKTGDWVTDHQARKEHAFERLIGRLDEIADCRQALVACDKFECDGGRTRLAKIDPDCLAAWDSAKQKLHQDDGNALHLVASFMKIASKRQAPKESTEIVKLSGDRTCGITIRKGFSVKLHGGQTYYIGQTCTYDGWNLSYFGQIKSITSKTVTVSRASTGQKNKRMKVKDFAFWNRRTVEDRGAENADTRMYI